MAREAAAPEVTTVASIAPPDGVLLLVSVDDEPVAIGGVRDLDGPVAEIKSMYVAPPARGRGIGRRMLAGGTGKGRGPLDGDPGRLWSPSRGPSLGERRGAVPVRLSQEGLEGGAGNVTGTSGTSTVRN